MILKDLVLAMIQLSEKVTEIANAVVPLVNTLQPAASLVTLDQEVLKTIRNCGVYDLHLLEQGVKLDTIDRLTKAGDPKHPYVAEVQEARLMLSDLLDGTLHERLSGYRAGVLRGIGEITQRQVDTEINRLRVELKELTKIHVDHLERRAQEIVARMEDAEGEAKGILDLGRKVIADQGNFEALVKTCEAKIQLAQDRSLSNMQKAVAELNARGDSMESLANEIAERINEHWRQRLEELKADGLERAALVDSEINATLAVLTSKVREAERLENSITKGMMELSGRVATLQNALPQSKVKVVQINGFRDR